MVEAKNRADQDKDLELIRKRLLERKRELDEQLAELYAQKGPVDQIFDLGDQVQSSSLETLRSSLQDAELDEYNMIVQALQKIDEGTYGICIDCGQPISEKRLKSYPNVTRCLVCQEVLEERSREP